ncbi:acetyl-coenzyme A synthetase, cytoplasmic-like [Porites lutea]|uniref:acetyl-coenzyme A synthetase, cytoplasmic-like n=1 Tax=Porites lutea TaxID=51062 RepID=UPI003CC5330B
MASANDSVNEHEKELVGWFYPPDKLKSEAYVSSMDQYKETYQKSIDDPASFWGDIANEFYWKIPPNQEKFMDFNFDTQKGKVSIKWMEGAVTNISYNMLDRNVEKGLGDNVAFYWEGNFPGDSKQITYSELLSEVCKFANVLKDKGIKKGDRIAIYMPMINELVVAMLACARIGAVHSIVFGGFSAESLAERILDSKCRILITADGSYRGKKLINLKEISDEAIGMCKEEGFVVESCIVVQHVSRGADNGNSDPPVAKRPCPEVPTHFDDVHGIDCWWHDVMSSASDQCDPCWTDAEDPLFMLYTSGSTGKPKGVLHTVGGYMIYTATTFKYTFDYHPGEVYWCTADIGWITGHSYITYGPLANGATSVLFEGTPFYPDSGRFWDVVDKYNVSKFYTAPTAIRALMKFGKAVVKKSSRKSLKVLGTVGEPINPEAWLWYYHTVGDAQCSIVDTYWQTETGGHVITSLPGATPMRPGAASFPFFGVVPAIVDEHGNELEGPCEGFLVMKQPWPGMARTIYGDHERFERVYFSKFPGYYTTGDGCKRDSNGYYWITGRTDDCMNVSGHLLSTAQVESALVEHDAVTEAAVVSCPHKEKGEGIYCFTTLMEGVEFNEQLKNELKQKVRTKIGPFATPDIIQNAPGLPKTRSGKIMRRVLRHVAKNDKNIGDTTTMADSSVVDTLFENRPNVNFLPD